MQGYITPKGWESFQHYKDRKPAWIKLHRDLLDNYEFHCLPLASKALAPCLWLLASEYEGGQIPADFSLIGFRLRLSEKQVEDAVTPLIQKGFFIASNPLAECKQDACLEKEIETERERDISPSDLSPADAVDGQQDATRETIPCQSVVDVYNEVCGDLFPAVAKLTDQRRKAIKRAWNADKANPTERARTNSLDYWRRYFGHCLTITFFRKAASGELSGEHVGWKPDFDFLIREKTWLGVLEGKYE